MSKKNPTANNLNKFAIEKSISFIDTAYKMNLIIKEKIKQVLAKALNSKKRLGKSNDLNIF